MTRIISSPQRDILSDRSRPIDTWRTSVQTRPRLPWIFGSERARRRWRDRTTPQRGRHRGSSSDAGTPHHPGQWPANGDADDDLFAKRPPDNEHRLDQHGQVGEVLNKLPDAGLKLHLPNHANLETEVAQSAAQVILDCDRLRL